MATQMTTHENMKQPATLEKICDSRVGGDAIMFNNALAIPKLSATSWAQPLQGRAMVPSTAISQTVAHPLPDFHDTSSDPRERYTATHIACYGNTPLPREYFMTRIGETLRELYDSHMATPMATHEHMRQPATL